MNCVPTQTLDLPLDTDEEHPRRLLLIGTTTNHVIAYGGDDGTVALIERAHSDSDDDKTSSRAIRRFDDDSVRAIAVSDDGKRVVIGSDSGNVQVYSYDDYENGDHPFITNCPDLTRESQPDNNDMFMSQSDALQSAYTGETIFAGPCYEALVRDVKFLPNSHYVAIATETKLAIVNVESSSTITENAQELPTDVGVRGVSITAAPTDDDDACILSAMDMNGRLTHYTITMDENNAVSSCEILLKESRLAIEKRDVGEMLGASPACRSSRPLWIRLQNPKQTVLAVGGQTYLQLRTLSKDKLKLKEQDQPLSITDDETGSVHGHLDSIVLVEAIGDDYVVSCGRDKLIVLWKLETRKDGSLQAHFVRQLGKECDGIPTDLLWHKDVETKSYRLYVATDNGKLVVMEGRELIIPESAKESLSVVAAATHSDSGTSVSDAKEMESSRKNHRELDTDNEEDEFDALVSPPKKNSGQVDMDTSPIMKNRFIDDEADDDDDNSDDDSLPRPTKKHSFEDANNHTTDPPGHIDDDGSEGGDFDVEQYRLATSRPTMLQPTLKLPDPQPAFAPSSTPLGMARRFMCWNHIGAITHIQGVPGVSRSSIDIDFTDTLTRRPVNFTDNIGFILGSVGEDGAVFATDLAVDEDEEDDDDLKEVIDGLHMSETTKAALKKSQQKRMKKEGTKATGSTIFFHRFDTFAAIRDKDWYLTLPDGERALGCACGEGWAAVMTSRRFLRLFTSGGNQGQVIWLPGEAVSMVGRGRFLAVFYHEAPPMMDETQKLGFLMFDAAVNRLIHKGSTSCISSGSCLAWAGFTNECTLVAMDSDGMLSMLACSGADDGINGMSWNWVPVLDTVGLRKSIEDSFWPVTVYDGKLVCVPLKGGAKHPDATRRPVTATLGLRLPLARGTLSAVNALEELSVRADIAFNQKKTVHMLLGDTDDEAETELRTISAQLDKVTLKMFAAVVEAGKLERALDLVDRLHLEKSFDLAMKIADHQHKLVDLIEEAKDRRFGGPEEEDEEEVDHGFTVDAGSTDAHTEGPQRITPDAALGRKTKRAFDDISAMDLKDRGSRQVRNRSAFA